MADKKPPDGGKCDPKPHPTLEALAERGSRSAVPLTGYVGPSPAGSIRIYARLDVPHYVELANDDCARAETDPESGLTTLWVSPSTSVDIVRVESKTVAAVKKDNDPDGGGKSTDLEKCIQDSIDRCIKGREIDGTSPDVAKKVCEDLRWLFEIFCKSPITLPEPPKIA
jgi:hypothetical protein